MEPAGVTTLNILASFALWNEICNILMQSRKKNSDNIKVKWWGDILVW